MNPLLRMRFLAGGPKKLPDPVVAIEVAEPAPSLALAERAVGYARQARAASTNRVYGIQWRRFSDWCRRHGREPLPADPGLLALYLTERADGGARVSSLEQAISAIARQHKLARLPAPHEDASVQEVWTGIRRAIGRAKRRATPVTPSMLREMIRGAPDGRAALRDAALVLVGFAGAFRRGELVALDVADVAFTDDGLLVSIRRSKTDQEAVGAVVPIPFGSDRATCPVRALRAWLEASGIAEGAIFRGVHRSGRIGSKRLSTNSVSRILKRAAKHASLSVERLSGHSLRSGLGTTAAKQGKRLEVIQKHMRHKRLDQTLEYVRQASAFDEDDNAASGIGL
jgi:integrase